MSYQVKVEILGGRSYQRKTGKSAGSLAWIHDCIIRDDSSAFSSVHFADEQVKPGVYVGTVQIGVDRENRRTFYLNDLRPLAAPASRSASA